MKRFTKRCGLGISIIVSAMFASCGGNNAADSFFEDVDLIPVTLSKDGKWSMINAKGEVVYEDEFKNRPSMCYNGVFSVEEGEGYSIYKMGSKGPEVFGEAENLKYAGYMSEGLIPVTFPKKRISVLDKNGKQKFELAPVKGSEVVSCSDGFAEGLLSFRTEDSKCGYFDATGKVAIQPAYLSAGKFSDGLAVVSQEVGDSTDTKTEYIVINKKGETVFKIKDGYDLHSMEFNNGYLYAKNDDRAILIDKKGEIVKFPAKISNIVNWNSKYVIFYNEEDSYGVANLEGEIIIRPKYEYIDFDSNDNFLACKDPKDKEVLRLDKEGNEIAKLDYERVAYMGKFGYFAKDGNTISLIDKDGKSIGNNDFYDVSTTLTASSRIIESDYFNMDAISATLVGMIATNGVGNIKVNEPASKIFTGKEASSYSYTYNTDMPDLNKEGFRYDITCRLTFNESIAVWDYNYSTYTGSYKWNPESKVESISLNLSTQNDWGKDGFDSILKALKEKGWKEYKVGEMYDIAYMGILKKGALSVFVECPKEGKRATVSLADANSSAVSAVSSNMSSVIRESNDAKSATTVPNDTTVAVEAVEEVAAAN